MTVALHFVPQQLDIPAHFLVALLEIDNEVNGCEANSETQSGEFREKRRTFAENFPLAGLHPAVRRQLVPQLVEQLLHFFSPFALG